MAQVAPLVLVPSEKTSSLQDTDAAISAQRVALGRVGYALAYGGLYGLHAVCAAYLVVAGYIYTVLHTTYVHLRLVLYQLSLDTIYHPAIAAIHFGLACIHGYFLLKPLAPAATAAFLPSNLQARVANRIASLSRAERSGRYGKVVRFAHRIYDVLFGHDGLFGVHSAHFELVFLAREVVETVLQSYQAYTMNRILSRDKLNSIYTFLLVLNCWTTPLLRHVYHHNKPLEHVLVLLCNMVLDFVSAIGVPVAVAIGYLQQYDPVTTNFAPWTLYYKDVWLLTFLNEMPLLFFGDATDFEAVYSVLDANSVQYVIFRHCPTVEFTPRFLTFRNLVGIKTHNSTIATWNLDAACTATAHPRVRYVFMSRTQFPNATLPLGLRHEQFPATLVDIEIAVSNIQWIPPTLPWPPTMLISIEFSQLVEFPMVFARLQPNGLSLAFNRITTIPPEAIQLAAFARVHFRGNPIQELPTASVEIPNPHGYKSSLSIQYTNVTTLPAWVTARFLDTIQIFAAQTPLCVQVLQTASSPERDLWLRERPWLVKVEAACAKDPGFVGMYPLQVEAD